MGAAQAEVQYRDGSPPVGVRLLHAIAAYTSALSRGSVKDVMGLNRCSRRGFPTERISDDIAIGWWERRRLRYNIALVADPIFLASVVHLVDARFTPPPACQPIKSLHHVIEDAQRTERA